MSRGKNKVNILGRLGQDPEMRYMPDGKAVATLSIATSSQFKDKESGEVKEHTEWHRVVFFGRIAEVCGEYLKKGAEIDVEGKLRTRKWTDKSNVDRYTTEIVGKEMLMLGSSNANNESQSKSNKNPTALDNPPLEEDFDDDVPF